MLDEQKIEIQQINSSVIDIDDVHCLWRKFSKTLGFFPKGAFDEYKSKNQIIVAIKNEKLAGYLLYRVSNRNIAIVHLCVDEVFQGKRIPQKLFNFLKLVTQKYDGVSLSCRRDYGIDALWSGLGFKAITERKGRGHDKGVLTHWWYDYGKPDLFSNVYDNEEQKQINIVIDANVFFDFNSKGHESEESQSLLADWLDDKVQIFLTSEIHNEVNRCKDNNKREKERSRISYYSILPDYPDTFHNHESELKKLYTGRLTERDKSDIRQMAHAIAADAVYFITRDDIVLKKSDAIYDLFELSVMRPSEFIVNIDMLERESDYRPSRFLGTDARIFKLGEVDEKGLALTFQRQDKGETKSDFLNKLRGVLKDPVNNECFVIKNGRSDYLGLLCYKKGGSKELEVPLIRAAKSKLENTILHYLSFKSVLDSTENGNIFTNITDEFLDENIKNILIGNGFIKAENSIVKLNINTVNSLQGVKDYISLNQLNESFYREINKRFKKIIPDNKALLWEAEKLIWPGKIIEESIDNFIISIKPGWARELFDYKLASSDLFGAPLELAVSVEGAYYRSIKNSGGLSFPSRVLWYVSSDSQYKSVGVRACSQLEEIVIGKPKKLFKQFRHLGVYEWNDVYKVSDSNVDNDIMVLRFKNTEVFDKSVSYNDVARILDDSGVSKLLLSPTKINSNVFSEIYKLGIN